MMLIFVFPILNRPLKLCHANINMALIRKLNFPKTNKNDILYSALTLLSISFWDTKSGRISYELLHMIYSRCFLSYKHTKKISIHTDIKPLIKKLCLSLFRKSCIFYNKTPQVVVFKHFCTA